MNSIPPAVVLLGGALALPLLPRSFRSLAFVLFPAAAMALLLSLEDGTTTLRFLSFDLVPLRVDRLSLAFGTIFLLATLLGGIYAFHLKELGQQVAALIYAGSSLGVVFSGDLFTLFVYWEIMAVSSAYLILARGMERSRRAAMRYVLVHLFGGSVLLAGILWHFVDSGSLLFNGFDREGAAYLIMFGFALNAGIPPLHAWLADAYPEGTVTGSVFLSAFTTKTAVYVLARGFAGWEILLWAGVIMALYGVVFAVLENDIRRLLAYHIISQVGYMVAGIGIVPSNLATHALTVGAIGGLTLGMMTRTARGHTGRPLRAEAAETACYVLINLAAVVRVFVPLAAPAFYRDTVILSGVLWASAFAVFVGKYWPILTRPRVDGRSG